MGHPYWFREIERRKVLRTTQRGCEIVLCLKEAKAQDVHHFHCQATVSVTIALYSASAVCWTVINML